MNITSGKIVAPRRIIAYGVHGIGKSTFASMAPKPIFVPTEDGLNDIECDKYAVADSFERVMANLVEVYEAKHSYRTLVVDSGDWLEKLIVAQVCAEENVPNVEKIGYAKGWVYALNHWKKFVGALDAIREARDMTVIILAHATVAKFENPETESYDRYIPALHKHAAGYLLQWADEVLFFTYKAYTKKEERGGFKKDRAIGVGGTERVIKTTERPSHVAKNRLNLPDEIALDWREYAKFLPVASKPGSGEKSEGKTKTNGNGKSAPVKAEDAAKVEAK